MKTCTKCGEGKALTEFHKDKHKKDGLTPTCKSCNRSRSRAHHKLKPRDPEQTRREKLKTRYGTTPEFIAALYEKQQGNCELCGEPLDGNYHIDHNHGTGEIRGLLHSDCNKGLGMFRDSPERLDKASAYLRRRGHYGFA